MERLHRQIPQCPHASCAAVELISTSVIPSSLMPCPISPCILHEIHHFLTLNVKTAIFIKSYHATCNRFCRVIASPSGYCQSSLFPAQCRNGKELWESITPPWEVSQTQGASAAIPLPSASLWKNPQETKSLREMKYCAYCLLFQLQNPSGFTSSFCGSLDKILHTAG